jgi:membrane protein required for colicin V production
LQTGKTQIQFAIPGFMPIDIIFLASFFFGFWKGYTQGIIGTVFNLIAYIFGVTLAFKVTPTMTNILERLFNSTNPTMFLAAFIVNLLLIMMVLRMFTRSLERASEAAYLGYFNSILGGVLLGGFSVMIYSVLIWFLVKVHFLNDATLAESRAYPLLEKLPGHAKNIAVRIKPLAEDIWGTSINWMDKLESYGIEKTEAPAKIYDPEDGKDGIERDAEGVKPSKSSVNNDGTGIE